MGSQEEWSARTADAIGQQIRHHRQARGLSVQQLADAVAAHGLVIQRPVLSNLENGRRHTISAAELLVIARVLDVPPVELLFPVGRVHSVEALPGVELDTWSAIQWFSGERPFPGDESVSDDPYKQSLLAPFAEHRDIPAAAYFREHSRLLNEWERVAAFVVGETVEEVEVQVQAQLRQRRGIEIRIRDLRAAMRLARINLPELPAALAAKIEGQ